MPTYSHAISADATPVKGGMAFSVGPSMYVSDRTPDEYSRSVIEANKNPRGAIIQKVTSRTFYDALNLGSEDVVLAFWSTGQQKRSYVLLSPRAVRPPG